MDGTIPSHTISKYTPYFMDGALITNSILTTEDFSSEERTELRINTKEDRITVTLQGKQRKPERERNESKREVGRERGRGERGSTLKSSSRKVDSSFERQLKLYILTLSTNRSIVYTK